MSMSRTSWRSTTSATAAGVASATITCQKNTLPSSPASFLVGVWEGTYILDGLMTNATEMQPSIVHADTQGQSTVIFGLAHLLGITLMPRIRNWKELTLFRPSKTARYHHLESLFDDPINWRLIETLWPDLL